MDYIVLVQLLTDQQKFQLISNLEAAKAKRAATLPMPDFFSSWHRKPSYSCSKPARKFFLIFILIVVPRKHFRRPFKIVKTMRDLFDETEVKIIKRAFERKRDKKRITKTDADLIMDKINYLIQYESQNKLKIRYKMETLQIKHYYIEI